MGASWKTGFGSGWRGVGMKDEIPTKDLEGGAELKVVRGELQDSAEAGVAIGRGEVGNKRGETGGGWPFQGQCVRVEREGGGSV